MCVCAEGSNAAALATGATEGRQAEVRRGENRGGLGAIGVLGIPPAPTQGGLPPSGNPRDPEAGGGGGGESGRTIQDRWGIREGSRKAGARNGVLPFPALKRRDPAPSGPTARGSP